jgi:hypothetical protein
VDNLTGGETGGQRGERATGTPNTVYDLSSVLFHALEGGASYDQYIQDAEEAGDQELVVFFRLLREQDSDRAYAVRMLLHERAPEEARFTPSRTGEGPAPEGRETSRAAEREHEEQGILERSREEARPREEGQKERGLLDRIKETLAGPEDQRREEPRR